MAKKIVSGIPARGSKYSKCKGDGSSHWKRAFINIERTTVTDPPISDSVTSRLDFGIDITITPPTNAIRKKIGFSWLNLVLQGRSPPDHHDTISGYMSYGNSSDRHLQPQGGSNQVQAARSKRKSVTPRIPQGFEGLCLDAHFDLGQNTLQLPLRASLKISKPTWKLMP
jgi:hypothetical protein